MEREKTMDYVDAINKAGIECLMLESEKNSSIFRASFGHTVKKVGKQYKEAVANLIALYRESGLTKDELRDAVDENGHPVLAYGVIETISRWEDDY